MADETEMIKKFGKKTTQRLLAEGWAKKNIYMIIKIA